MTCICPIVSIVQNIIFGFAVNIFNYKYCNISHCQIIRTIFRAVPYQTLIISDASKFQIASSANSEFKMLVSNLFGYFIFWLFHLIPLALIVPDIWYSLLETNSGGCREMNNPDNGSGWISIFQDICLPRNYYWLVITGLIIIWLLLSIDDIYEYFTKIAKCSILSLTVTKKNVEIIRWFIPRLISVILFSFPAIILTSAFKKILGISVLRTDIPVHLNTNSIFLYFFKTLV